LLDLPNKLDQYQILGRIALGGMAEVYKAVSRGVEGFEKVVAIKRILPHVAEDEEFITMFKDEARIAAQLQHSNIAQIYELKSEGETFYIVLEYVPGKDLRALFEHGRAVKRAMPLAQACYIIMQVCEGLEYAHNKKDRHGRPLGLIHRDVSPPNVLVSYEGEVKLIDFGVAKAAGRASQTQAGILKGKFGYMSPEQVRGATIDRRSDVFSLGAVLWEILCNQRLFQAETDFATLEKVRTVAVDPPSRINPAVSTKLEQIVMRSLHADLSVRYQTAAELHDALQAFMFEEGLFYSRKNLAEWMQEHFAKDIEAEKEKARQVPPAPPSKPAAPKSTTMPPGSRPPGPPIRPGGNKPPPPPAAPRPVAPAGRQASLSTEAHPSLASLAEAQQGKRTPPKPGRARAKTMVMTGSKPDIPGVGKKPGRPKPPGARGGEGGGADFDWDDDELETKLFEGQEEDALAATPGIDRTMLPTGAPPATSPPASASPAAAPSQMPPPSAAVTMPPPSGSPGVGMTMPPPSGAAPGGPRGLPAPGGRPPGVPLPGVGPGLPPPSSPAASGAGSMQPGYGQQQQAPYGQPQGYQQQPPQQQYQQQPPQQQYQQPPQQQQYQQPYQQQQQYQQPPQQQQYQQPPQQQHMPPPVAPGMAEPEEERKSNVGLIVGIIGGVLAILAAVAFFVFGPGLGGKDEGAGGGDKPESAEVSGSDAAPEAAITNVTIDVTPADATVMIDGKEIAGSGPRAIAELAAGPHKVEVSKGDAFLPFSQELTFTAGQSLPIKLEARDVTLTVTVTPASATISLLAGTTASEIGKGAASHKHLVKRDPALQYTIKGTADGFEDLSVPIVFTGDPAQDVPVVLVAKGAPVPVADPVADPGPTTKPTKKVNKVAKPKTAELKIGVAPGNPPATVTVDGKSEGRTPVFVKVTAGSHTVKWKWDDGKTDTQKATVADNESKLLKGNK
jgi:serine/threonine protein kinase